MPISGNPVYAPTTEPQIRTNASALQILRKPHLLGVLLLALISLATGTAMIASAIGDWMEAKSYAEEQITTLLPTTTTSLDEVEKEPERQNIEFSYSLLFGGLLMCFIGFVSLGIYLKYANWRRNCICPCPFLMSKKQSLARQLQCDNVGGCNQGIMALNPSTDPLVSHTHAPVVEMPSNRHEADEEERRRLMVNSDNKECLSSAEESDRMLEPDPRIVLRPLGHLEEA